MIEIAGKKYSELTLDFETFYGKDFTLSGDLNTSEYIRDPRFHVHGLAIKYEGQPAIWVHGKSNIKKTLASVDWKNTALIAHNTAFDGFILSEIYGHIPGFYVDTLSMARAAHGHHMRHNLDTIAKAHGRKGKVKAGALVNTKDKMVLTDEEMRLLGEYAVDDVEDTEFIFQKMRPFIPHDEMRLIDITMRMFCDPVLQIDIPRVEAELKNELGKKAAALLVSGATVSELMSDQSFAELIEKAGGSPPMKISKRTSKFAFAFAKSDLAFQSLAATGNEQVKRLCAARLAVKSTIGETRANRFLRAGLDGKRLPVLLMYSGAHTHRWSGGNKMNLQNLRRGGELRRSILAPEGFQVVVADSAQIEARILAWLAKEMDIVNAFAMKQDVYKLMAAKIYKVSVDDVTPIQRFVGKVCVLGLGYGMGPTKLQLTLEQGVLGPPVKLSKAECESIVYQYRINNQQIRALWKQMDAVISSMTLGINGTYGVLSFGKNYIRLPNKMFLQYYGLHGETVSTYGGINVVEATYLTRMGRSKLYGGLLTENVVQALARIVIAEQMLKISDAGYRIVTMTHDEIVCVAPNDKAQDCLDFMLQTMSTPPDWAPDLPLAAEGGFDSCYSK